MFKVCRTCLCRIYDSNYFTLSNNTVTAVIRNQLALCVPEMVSLSYMNQNLIHKFIL